MKVIINGIEHTPKARLTDDQRLALTAVWGNTITFKRATTSEFDLAYPNRMKLPVLERKGMLVVRNGMEITLTPLGLETVLRSIAHRLQDQMGIGGAYVDNHPIVYRAFVARYYQGKVQIQGFGGGEGAEHQWHDVDFTTTQFRHSATNHNLIF